MTFLTTMSQTVVDASSTEFAIAFAVAAVVALGAAWGAYAMLVAKRVLQDTPTALIRSASQGYLELKGHAELMDGLPIHAPLSGRPCVWYRYRVERRERSGGRNANNERWRTIDSGISDSLFYLVDPTGRCAVDPEGAKVTPSAKNVWYGNSRTPGRLDDRPRWLRFTGIDQIGRAFRYTESRIESGDPLYALGDFTTHGGAGADFDRPTEVRELLREWKKDTAGLLARFDANGDGAIDLGEWDSARSAAEKAVDGKRAEHVVAPPVDVLGHARGSRNPFILAARTEEEMMARFHWSAVALLILAVSATTLAIWMLSIR